MVGIPGIETKTEITHTFEMMNRMIGIFHEESDLAKLDFLLSFFVPYPGTPLYRKCIEVGFPPLSSLEEWATLTSPIAVQFGRELRWGEYYRGDVRPSLG